MRTDTRLRRFAPAIILTVAALSAAPTAAADGPDGLVVFGDSLSDSGNAFVVTGEAATAPFDPIPSAPYAIGGHHFSNGSTWVELLASDLRVPASAGPAARKPGKATNYAFGGARARVATALTPFDLSWQVDRFLDDSGGRASEGALYVVWLGGNDVRDALASLAIDPTGATAGAILEDAATTIGDNVFELYAAGAREFLVPNAPNIAVTPAVLALGAQDPAIPVAAEQLSFGFNAGLAQALDGLEALLPDIRIHRLDTFSILTGIAMDPGSVGLTEAARPCLTFGVQSGALCARPNDYLFWDGIHPTRATHFILAVAAREALEAP